MVKKLILTTTVNSPTEATKKYDKIDRLGFFGGRR